MMCRKMTHLVSFVLTFTLFSSTCWGLGNFDTLQEEAIFDPNIAHNPEPPDGAINEETWANLKWLPGQHAVSHNVYFGDNFDDVKDGVGNAFLGNQLAAWLPVGFPGFTGFEGLVRGTTYYWRVDEVNELHPDSPWKGDVWSFTIMPYTAYNPIPVDKARFIDPNVSLSWEAGYRAKLHYVYFGENFADVNEGINETFKDCVEDTTFTPGPLELGKIYWWRIDEFDGNITHKGDVWYFRTKSSLSIPDPNLACDPRPSDGVIYEDTWAALSWSPGQHAASHDVYFGDNFDDVNEGIDYTFYFNQLETWFVVGFGTYLDMSGLIPGTTYYWRIDEVNDLHPDSPWKGDVWSFTIRTRYAYEPNPADYSRAVDPNITLSWTAGIGAVSHIVYFGDNYYEVANATGGSPQQTTTYIPGPLQREKTYYWRVDEIEADGITIRGFVWSFSTALFTASNPYPPNNCLQFFSKTNLAWRSGSHAVSHDVYFGDNFNDVQNGLGDTFQGNQLLNYYFIGYSSTGYPEALKPDTTYHWRIDEVNDLHPDSPWKGEVWNFTTLHVLDWPITTEASFNQHLFGQQ